MPRKARVDAAGAVHHVIGRGINRQAIFSDKKGPGSRQVVVMNEEVFQNGTILRFKSAFRVESTGTSMGYAGLENPKTPTPIHKMRNSIIDLRFFILRLLGLNPKSGQMPLLMPIG